LAFAWGAGDTSGHGELRVVTTVPAETHSAVGARITKVHCVSTSSLGAGHGPGVFEHRRGHLITPVIYRTRQLVSTGVIFWNGTNRPHRRPGRRRRDRPTPWTRSQEHGERLPEAVSGNAPTCRRSRSRSLAPLAKARDHRLGQSHRSLEIGSRGRQGPLHCHGGYRAFPGLRI
jgi:hypothetical protein